MSDSDKKRVAEQFLRVGSSGPERAIRELFSDGDLGMLDLRPIVMSPPPPVAVMVACPSCGQRNRIRHSPTEKPVCGRCKAPLEVSRE